SGKGRVGEKEKIGGGAGFLKKKKKKKRDHEEYKNNEKGNMQEQSVKGRINWEEDRESHRVDNVYARRTAVYTRDSVDEPRRIGVVCRCSGLYVCVSVFSCLWLGVSVGSCWGEGTCGWRSSAVRVGCSPRCGDRRRSFFFFQAEDGIRDWSVTGVQTCALPI